MSFSPAFLDGVGVPGNDSIHFLVSTSQFSWSSFLIDIFCNNEVSPVPGESSRLSVSGTGGALSPCANTSVAVMDFRARGVATLCRRVFVTVGGAVAGTAGFFLSLSPTRGVARRDASRPDDSAGSETGVGKYEAAIEQSCATHWMSGSL